MATDRAGATNLRRFDAVLFDLDGTLIHSSPDLVIAVEQMLDRLDRPVPDPATIETWVGKGIPRLVHRALTGDPSADAPPGLHAQALQVFERCYAAQSGLATTVYPGVPEALDALMAAGVPLACVTNKSRRFTIDLLERFDLARRLAVVVTPDDARARKPDPAPLHLALAQLGALRGGGPITAARAVMIGDSDNDAMAARRAGCAAWCVPYGYREGAAVEDLCADRIVADIAEAGRLVLGLERLDD
jgi:phosphoglycolate phosphatase